MALLPVSIKRKCLRIAKIGAPRDTGNLSVNAIIGTSWTNESKFKIKYSSEIAPYVEILQDSTWQGTRIKRDNKHHGFINTTVANITSMLNNYYATGKSSRMQSMKRDDLFSLDRRIKVYQRSIEMSRLLREAGKENE